MEETYFTIDFGVNFANKKRYPENKLEEIMINSYNSGVDKVVSISNDIQEIKVNLGLQKKYDNLYFTIGVHPHNANQLTTRKNELIKLVEENINNPKCFGIGECGLDYNRLFSTKEEQIDAFKFQITLAKKYNKPLYLHCREAYDDFIMIIKEQNYFNGLVHCFTGTLSQALEFTRLGFKLGITGWLLDKRRNHDLLNAIKNKNITINMLVVETDAPFMPIYPKKTSEPSDMGYIIEEIARLKNIDVIECGKIIYNNSLELLQIN